MGADAIERLGRWAGEWEDGSGGLAASVQTRRELDVSRELKKGLNHAQAIRLRACDMVNPVPRLCVRSEAARC